MNKAPFVLGLLLFGCAEQPWIGASDAGGPPARRDGSAVDPVRRPDGAAGEPDGARPGPDATTRPPDGKIPPSDGESPDPDSVTPRPDSTSPLPDSGTCLTVVGEQRDPWSHRLPSAGFGGIVTRASGGHNDVFLKSPTDYIRIGARLNWGGTVVFFGLSANPASNVIDANDTGRELQIALYDKARRMQGCAHDASCQSGSPCPGSITFLGWNPVQGGDECGHGGKVLSHGRSGDALQLVVQPVQWNPDWNQPDCRKSACPAQGVPVEVTYTMELRFVSEHVVEVMNQVTSQETISHPVSGQEWPTLYVSHGSGGPDLPLLLDAAGKAITISTPGNDGFLYQNFTSPRPWVSWQNAQQDYGVGLAMDQGISAFQGWGGGAGAPYFHNVRANVAFGLDAGATVRGIAYLALGGHGTVKGELESVLAKRPPFGTLDIPGSLEVTATAGASVPIHGWVLDTTAIAAVRVEIDGQLVTTIPRNQQRPDVCKVYPGYAGCPAARVGFAGSVTTAGLGSACPHLLQVIAEDPDGNSSVLGQRRLVITR